MTRIETDGFILTEKIVDSDGESTWIVTERKSNRIFYIHLFNKNCLYIKFFKNNKIKNPSEAIKAFCNYLVTKRHLNPTIKIFYTNKALISVCTKSGFRKQKNAKYLYFFKYKE